MPIAAKFSEAFYARFGHEATGELVEYLNTIDSTYRAGLERLNGLNWSRVEARIDQLEARVDQKLAEVRAEIRVELAALKAELLKWMFLLWVGTIGTVIALQQL